jgi:hypothetical protein
MKHLYEKYRDIISVKYLKDSPESIREHFITHITVIAFYYLKGVEAIDLIEYFYQNADLDERVIFISKINEIYVTMTPEKKKEIGYTIHKNFLGNRLLNQGKFTAEEVTKLLRMSLRISPYLNEFVDLFVKIPPMRLKDYWAIEEWCNSPEFVRDNYSSISRLFLWCLSGIKTLDFFFGSKATELTKILGGTTLSDENYRLICNELARLGIADAMDLYKSRVRHT